MHQHQGYSINLTPNLKPEYSTHVCNQQNIKLCVRGPKALCCEIHESDSRDVLSMSQIHEAFCILLKTHVYERVQM